MSIDLWLLIPLPVVIHALEPKAQYRRVCFRVSKYAREPYEGIRTTQGADMRRRASKLFPIAVQWSGISLSP